ncbi:MAG TPA: peroxiredoxin [Holophagaceae bacterium]|nr:peroxiredoxin [Holophagaceae bacterium]
MRKGVATMGILSLLGLNASAGDLKVGEKAPAFEAQDQNGKTIRLADYAGKQNVVLYFYPKDDTPGCTKEACSLRDGHGAILATGSVVLGVSGDDVKSKKAFAEKYHLPFSILADPGKKILEAYGVKMPVIGIARRVTFIIDKAGTIRHILTEVNTAAADKQVLELLKGL